jgi:undecaprenyl-diphosphatase
MPEPTPLKTVILGVIQGLTEFLPVSSDGHLALGQRLLHTGGELEMTVLLHAGTLLATLIVFRKEIATLLRELLAVAKDPSRLRRDPRAEELLAVVIASVPTAIIGFALKDLVDRWTRVLWIVALCFLGTGAALVASRYGRERQPWRWTPGRALLVGMAQGLAVLPGLSRSASTLAMALLLGAPPADAFRFSFVASIPAVAGALVLELAHEGALARAGGTAGLIGAAVSFVVGIAALLALRGIVSRGKLWQFAIYVVPLALVTLVLSFL